MILKIFTSEFYVNIPCQEAEDIHHANPMDCKSIGALFALYGAGVLAIALFRRQQDNKQFFQEIGEDGLNHKRFRTSGNAVVVLSALSVGAYACLLALTLELGG